MVPACYVVSRMLGRGKSVVLKGECSLHGNPVFTQEGRKVKCSKVRKVKTSIWFLSLQLDLLIVGGYFGVGVSRTTCLPCKLSLSLSPSLSLSLSLSPSLPLSLLHI